MSEFMELLERDRCLAALSEWRVTASEHGGCVVLVGGEAGIGKTALLREFSSRQRDLRVLWGGCDDLFTPRPLAPLHDIARQCLGELSQAFGSGASREHIFAAALSELERTPALVVFEDMHWADEATLEAQYQVKDDDEKFLATSRAAAQQLEKLFEADRPPAQ